MRALWFVGGTDPSGGAGLSADLRIAHALGVEPQILVTTVTSQNGKTFTAHAPVNEEMLAAQWAALAAVAAPDIIKLGLIADRAQIRLLSRLLSETDAFVILDPVLGSTSGKVFHEESTLSSFIEDMFPYVDLLTPNLPEAERFLKREIKNELDVERAARDLGALGPRNVLLKGGHAASTRARDYLWTGMDGYWLQTPRIKVGKTHGTGCTLAAAIASLLAREERLVDAIVAAKSCVTQLLRRSSRRADGITLLGRLEWPLCADDFAEIPSGSYRKFPREDEIGFYPIVPDEAWFRRVVSAGARFVQLRIKNESPAELRRIVGRCHELACREGVKLYLNDYWELALDLKIYGVHLGQDDLDGADIRRLQAAGLRLGLSTHSYFELARSLSFHPSYVALGPIFATNAKRMIFSPQGISRIEEWKRLTDLPLVAIGGIPLERAQEIFAAGADGIAVISDVTQSAKPEARIQAWLELNRPSFKKSKLGTESLSSQSRSAKISPTPEANLNPCPENPTAK